MPLRRKIRDAAQEAGTLENSKKQGQMGWFANYALHYMFCMP